MINQKKKKIDERGERRKDPDYVVCDIVVYNPEKKKGTTEPMENCPIYANSFFEDKKEYKFSGLGDRNFHLNFYSSVCFVKKKKLFHFMSSIHFCKKIKKKMGRQNYFKIDEFHEKGKKKKRGCCKLFLSGK